jgi:hypothetical protein
MRLLCILLGEKANKVSPERAAELMKLVESLEGQ